MIYDFSKPQQLEEALQIIAEFSAHEKKVEIKVYSPRRSQPQNRGLHLLLGHLSNETGYTLDEAKELYKQMNRDMYTYTKNEHEFTRSSAELTEAEMAKSIDRLYTVCAENGITLPLLTNEAEMRSVEAAMERNSHFN